METIKQLIEAANASAVVAQAIQDEIKILVNALREVTWGGEAGLNSVGSYKMANELLEKYKSISYEPVKTQEEKGLESKAKLLSDMGLQQVELPF